MSWKKKRRLPMSWLSLVYVICGTIFMLANVYMMHSGFIYFYDDPTTVNGEILQGVSHQLDRSQHTIDDIPVLALPNTFQHMNGASHIRLKLLESKLRQLTRNSSKSQAFLYTDELNQILKRRKKHTSNNRIDDISYISQLVSVSEDELRVTLNKTSRCADLQKLERKGYIASGWTKAVYSVKLDGRPVALKTIDLGGHDMIKCSQYLGLNVVECYTRASHKILKEILLLGALQNANVAKVLDYCVPVKPYDTTPATEISMAVQLGDTIDIIKLLQMSWEDRLRISLGITQLVVSLADSPLGNIAINDFRRQQFVLIGGEIKLSDVDDISFDEPHCDNNMDCIHIYSSANFTLRTDCIKGRCIGYNERKNIFNAARHFTTFLLPHGAPASLRPDIDVIVAAYSNATLTSHQLLDRLDDVIEKYKSGEYLHRDNYQSAKSYKSYLASDLPGLFDYRCRYSVASGTCTVSIFDQKEGEQFCDNDFDCKAFVISPERTWTGRMIAHLKNNFTRPYRNHKTNLFVKAGFS